MICYNKIALHAVAVFGAIVLCLQFCSSFERMIVCDLFVQTHSEYGTFLNLKENNAKANKPANKDVYFSACGFRSVSQIMQGEGRNTVGLDGGCHLL